MVVGGRAASVLPLNLPHLQNLIKRDSESYRTEFHLQQTHFYSTLALMQAGGWEVEACGGDASDEGSLENLITFMSHCVPCFITKNVENDATKFVATLMDLLERDAASLPATLRRCMCQALILMRSKKGVSLVPTERMLKLFFRLFGLKDKQLRELLYDAIVSDVRKANHPHRNNALNRSLQNFMYSIFSSSTISQAANSSNNSNSNNNNNLNAVTSTSDEMTATKSLQVIIELYRRGIWNDSKTVNIISEAALKGNCPKAMVMALNFFLGKYPGAAEVGVEDEEDQQQVDGNASKSSKASIASSEEYRSLLHACQVGGVSKAKSNRLKRILASDRKKARANVNSSGSSTFSPLSLVNDPQGFAERLYRLLKGSNATFEVKLLMMNVLSRFIAWHKLLVLDFYSFLLRYLQPHQRLVTQVLAYTAQATHALVPPDTLYPVLRAIADNFVSEGAAEPIIAAGLNGIREICTRAPLAMTETLLQDLTGYKKGGDHKNKGVMMAARSLITLFREINPDLLHRRDRGRDVSMAMSAGSQKKTLAYGEVECYDGTKAVKEEGASGGDDAEDGDGGNVSSKSDISDEELIFEELSEGESEDEEEGDSDFDDFDSNDEECPELVEKSSKRPSKEPAVKSKRVKFLPTERILLPEDFEKKSKDSEAADNSESDGSSDSDSEEDDENVEPSEFIDPSKIEGYRSRAKADYEARLASIHSGREGRDKFGTRKRGNSRSSTTNKEKSKGKNFLMMAHKFEVKGKSRRSLKARQAVQKKHRSNMKSRR